MPLTRDQGTYLLLKFFLTHVQQFPKQASAVGSTSNYIYAPCRWWRLESVLYLLIWAACVGSCAMYNLSSVSPCPLTLWLSIYAFRILSFHRICACWLSSGGCVLCRAYLAVSGLGLHSYGLCRILLSLNYLWKKGCSTVVRSKFSQFDFI